MDARTVAELARELDVSEIAASVLARRGYDEHEAVSYTHLTLPTTPYV